MNLPSPADHLTFYTYLKRQILVGIKTEWKLISQRILWVNIYFLFVRETIRYYIGNFTEICMDHPENINTNHRWSSGRMENEKHCHTYIFIQDLVSDYHFPKGPNRLRGPPVGTVGHFPQE